MSKRIDLTGQYFGYLKVIEEAGKTKHGYLLWLCECKCGKRKIVNGRELRNEDTKSCGCLRREKTRERSKTHGMSKGRLYKIWVGMIQRTQNRNTEDYKDYGERGIEVCEEWRNSFEAFEQWSTANGYAENLTIDRKDNNKGYSPENCHWVTGKEQGRNKRNNHCLTYNGQTKTIAEWAEITGIKNNILYARINRGWSAEKALETPVKSHSRKN